MATSDVKFKQYVDQVAPEMAKRKGWTREQTEEILKEIWLEHEVERPLTDAEDIKAELTIITDLLRSIESRIPTWWQVLMCLIVSAIVFVAILRM